jgi:hypothetical protein
MAGPAQPTQPGAGKPETPGKKGRSVAEFSRGRGRPKLSMHKVSLKSLRAEMPGIHKIGK